MRGRWLRRFRHSSGFGSLPAIFSKSRSWPSSWTILTSLTFRLGSLLLVLALALAAPSSGSVEARDVGGGDYLEQLRDNSAGSRSLATLGHRPLDATAHSPLARWPRGGSSVLLAGVAAFSAEREAEAVPQWSGSVSRRQPGPVLQQDHTDVRAVVCAPQWAWPCDEALVIVACESSFNTWAYNPAGPYVGAWQILNGPFDLYLNTVEANIQYAQWKNGDRADPWPGCP